MQSNHRRHFLKQGIAAGLGFWVSGHTRPAWSQAKSANQQLQFACIGVGGKGAGDTGDAGIYGKVVALCDVDERMVEKMALRFPEAKKFYDFRDMFVEMGESIDAVTVSTPDHTHAVAAVTAMRMGKHCFCQKPLTHSVSEARLMGQIAREMGVKTQMGNQGTASANLRRAAAVLKSGVMGEITAVHVWSDRPVWPQGIDRPTKIVPVPKFLHWDQWLGPAPERPYHPAYHPFKWRGFWDFGTGALGDMACHTFNMPYMGLNLRDPIAIEAESPGHNGETYPGSSVIRFQFPALGPRGPVEVTWYDGGKRPDESILRPEYVKWVEEQNKPPETKGENGQAPPPPTEAVDIDSLIGSGAIVIGSKAVLFAPGDYADDYKLFGADHPEVEVIESPGHFKEWVEAIHEGGEAMSNFPNYAAPLTETILLGNLALWKGGKVEWDAANLKAVGRPDLDKLIRREYRSGYSLDVVPAAAPV